MIVFIRSNPIAPDPRVEKEVQSLTTNGFKVTILAWDREKAFNKLESCGNKTIWRLRFRAPYRNLVIAAYYPIFWLWVLSKLLKIRPIVIHACDVDSIFPALLYRLLKHEAKVVFDMFDVYALLLRSKSKVLSNFVFCLELFAASKSNAFITVSTKRLALFESAKPKLVEVVMNCPSFMPRSRLLSQSMDKTKFRMVYAGAISPGRGLLQLCEASKDIDDLELVVAGRVMDRKTLDKINQFSHTKYVGQLKYDAALKLQASADLIPALYDPTVALYRVASPNKIFEAMMLGIPVITNLVDIIEETKCGVKVNYHDVKGITQTILYIKEHPKVRLKLGLNGKRAFELKFNWSQMENKLLKLYYTLMSP